MIIANAKEQDADSKSKTVVKYRIKVNSKRASGWYKRLMTNVSNSVSKITETASFKTETATRSKIDEVKV